MNSDVFFSYLNESINADKENNTHIHHHAAESNEQKETVSWFSREEENKESKNPQDMNWMQSKPEDSMGGHMYHGMEGMSNKHMNRMHHEEN